MSPQRLLATLVLAVSLGLAGGATAARGASAQQQNIPLSITLQPQAGPPGTQVTIFGRGAPPFAAVRLNAAAFADLECRVAAAGQTVTEVRADALGQFTAQVRASRLSAPQAGYVYSAGVVTGGTAQPSPGATACFQFDLPPVYPQTGYRVELDAFWDYFTAYGGVDTFGFPISDTTMFMGCTTQFFQRGVLQRCADGAVKPMNVLDPQLLAVDSVNYSVLPPHNTSVAMAAPAPGSPGYGAAVLSHLQSTVPNQFEGLPVDFFSTYVNTVPGEGGDPVTVALRNLEVWGFPTSRPAFDPTNRNFVYQRFQRGIMHYSRLDDATRGMLVGDWLKSALTGADLPGDLAAQLQGTPILRQYCPGNPRALCRPDQLPATDLTGAF